jgi:DNA invertase Pin-like site-specific DNA recombinase
METKLIGYIRVSTDKQIESGAGIDAQIAYLNAEATRRNAQLEIVSEGEGASGKSTAKRSALNDAMARLDKGEANALIVYKLDRLTRSVADFLTILERSRKGKWALIIGDLSIDTSTPMGEAMATISATFAQLERRRIGERTRDGLAQKKLQGVTLGRPVLMEASTVEKIIGLHNEGLSFRAIARQLNLEAIPTTHGGLNWYASTVSKTVARLVA